jgi:hypothetical protein
VILAHRKMLFALFTACYLSAAESARAAPPAPSAPHPRLFLDTQTLQALQAQANVNNSVVRDAITDCNHVQSNPGSHNGGGWAGFDFVAALVPCLIAYKATGSAGAKAAAFKYFDVLLDDKDTVGDNLGGDTVVRHDTGYFVRTFAPYSALAYDWLYNEPEMTPALRAKALGRFKAWSDWYRTGGYLNDVPGANYQAGWVFAATLIAVAQGADAGADGEALWSYVVDTVWGSQMAAEFAPGGVLRDGEWLEGWQYGPLSVAEYAISARALNERGVTTPGMAPFLAAVVLRHHYALLPGRNEHLIVADTSHTEPYTNVTQVWMSAVIASNATTTTRAQTRGLMQRVGSQYETDLFGALAEAAGSASESMPADLPTMYLADVAGNFYVRSAWTDQASYAVLQCGRPHVPDHTGHKATNFVLSRGADDLVIDTTPYGSDTLASNAVAIDYGRAPTDYSPFQAPWNQATHLDWSVQTTSGVAVARCDFQDAFRVSWEANSTVDAAMRDFVFVPHAGNVSLVMIDRIAVENAAHHAHIRYRSPGSFSLLGGRYTATVGGSRLLIQTLTTPNATPTIDTLVYKSYCDRHDYSCQLTGSRVTPASQVRLSVPNASKTMMSVLDGFASSGTTPASATPLSGTGYTGVTLYRDNERVVVIAADHVLSAPPASLTYDVEASGALHVVVDSPASGGGLAAVNAAPGGAGCRVTVAPHASGTGYAAKPLLFRLSPGCVAVPESTQVPIVPAADLPVPNAPTALRAQ